MCSNLSKTSSMCSNVFKLVQTLFKCVQMGSNSFKTCSNEFKFVQMGSKLVQMCQMCSSLSKTCSNVFKCVQNCSKIICLSSARGPTWQAVLDLVLNDDNYEEEIYARTKHVTTVIERGASAVCLWSISSTWWPETPGNAREAQTKTRKRRWKKSTMTSVHICIFDTLWTILLNTKKIASMVPNHKESVGQVFGVMSREGQVW